MNHAKRLYQAAKQGDVDRLNVIARKAVTDQVTEGLTEWQDEQGRTALNIAATMREWRCIEWLILMGADINHRGRDGITALQQAVLSNSTCIPTLRVLLASGAKMMLESSCGETAWDVVKRYPERTEVLNLFRQYFKNDATFDDFIRVKEKHTRGGSEQVYMRRVMVLHRHTIQGNIRRFILLCPTGRSTQTVKHWIDTIDLDSPTLSLTHRTFAVQFVRHLFTKHGRCCCPCIEVPNQFFGLTTEPTSPPDLPEVVGLNDVISQFNSVFHDAVGDHVTGTSSGAPSRSRICTICYERPINSGFVHGTSVHCCACTVCADIIMKNSNATCPVCRETIQHVVANFFI